MSNEFDEMSAFEFEDDFESETDLFDDLDGLEDIVVRTAVLRKNDMLALLCIKSATAGAAICRVDPREKRPAVQLYDDPKAAHEWFAKSLRTSRKNGWNVVYDGLPLQG